MKVLALVLGVMACGSSEPVARGTGEPPRCPDVPSGDAAAHLAAVERMKRDPSKANVAALENETWTELWAVTARMGAEPAIDDWPGRCADRDTGYLNCFQQRWRSVHAALALPAVTSITCNVCRVGDLSALAAHPALVDLSLSDTYLEQPASIRALVNLEKLTLQNTNLEGAAELAGLAKLTKLTLSGPLVHDVAAIAGLRQLEELSLIGSCLRRLPDLGALTELELLAIRGGNLESGPSLAQLTKLRTFVWNGAALTDASALTQLRALRHVIIENHCLPADEAAELERVLEARGVDVTIQRRSTRCKS